VETVSFNGVETVNSGMWEFLEFRPFRIIKFLETGIPRIPEPAGISNLFGIPGIAGTGVITGIPGIPRELSNSEQPPASCVFGVGWSHGTKNVGPCLTFFSWTIFSSVNFWTVRTQSGITGTVQSFSCSSTLITWNYKPRHPVPPTSQRVGVSHGTIQR